MSNIYRIFIFIIAASLAGCTTTHPDTTIAASDEDLPGIHQIRQKVYQELGLFGMPHSCTYVDSLPVTPNGKIDRKAIRLAWIEL